ncbi:MAG: hypothetical protein FJ311_14495 [Rhodospirillales bacterium]|nr:hypothetical protein [Rhodospirillales bacterium]
MGLPEKAYFGLEEIEERWGLPRRDLVYLVENGILKVSVRVWNLPIERGYYEDGPANNPHPVALEQRRVSGLLDLDPGDARRLIRDRRSAVRRFAAPEGEYLCVMRPETSLDVRIEDLAVRREERDRIERDHPVGARAAGRAPFEHRDGYKEIDLQGRTFHLGPCQAKVVRVLHEAAKSGSPWRHGKAVLGEAGSSCSRMADLFKTQKDWRTLILSDRKGRYRLNLPIP